MTTPDNPTVTPLTDEEEAELRRQVRNGMRREPTHAWFTPTEIRLLLATLDAARTDSLDVAWAAAEAALPEGWRPITVGPPDPDAYDKAGNAITEPWYAATVSPAFFNGETEGDAEWACGYGPTPAAALLALRAALDKEPKP